MNDKHVALIRTGNEYMRLYADGSIGRASGHHSPGGDWRITGAVRFNNFGYEVQAYSLAVLLTNPLQWRYKNGAQRIHLTDFDHGTYRTWMNPGHEVIIL